MSLKVKTNSKSRFFCRDGFTFLEVLVAFSYTAIVLLAIYQIHSQTILLESANRFNSIAPILAEQKLSEILSDDEELPSDDGGSFAPPYEGYQWQVRVSEIESEYLVETTKRLRKIIDHIESNENQYYLQTYRFFHTG